jgi:hypothetical protein
MLEEIAKISLVKTLRSAKIRVLRSHLPWWKRVRKQRERRGLFMVLLPLATLPRNREGNGGFLY